VIPSVIAENMTRGQTRMAQSNRLSPTDLPRFRVTTSHQWRPASTAARYGLALASVAVALGLAQAFLYFDLPLPFAAFALCAIWYGGSRPGILAALLTAVVRTFVFEPDVSLASRLVYDLVFLIFAALMTKATQARDELEVRVAERTAALTRANEDLRLEIAERAKAEAELRDSQAYLAESQRLTHTGSFGYSVAARTNIYWSAEHFRLYGFDPEGGIPPFETYVERIHPDDRDAALKVFEGAIRDSADFVLEFRIVLPDGTMKDIHAVGHPAFDASGHLEQYVGTVMDATERRQADEERERLRQAQADLAHVSRVTSMGELTATLAHEVNQPIAAAVTDANTCLRWLQRDMPDVDEAREAASRVVKDATRAAEIVSRIRLLFKKGAPQREPVDLNEVVGEMIALLRGEATRHGILVRIELAAEVPSVLGDRVQVQQVLTNLIMNSIDAMKEVPGTRELIVTSQPTNEQVMISVSDTGSGLPAQHAQIFNAFFTTKPHGIGMGLSISRSIVESHGGRLWAANNSPRGASFHVTFPTTIEAHGSAGRADGLHHR
jgi:PAS domain S-box-containing protein